ncbi:MAG TPA: HNH endonuclease [Patescibacteria group bacterium]|nr:HNH endonuclease [Patescibacteria group bacterium]
MPKKIEYCFVRNNFEVEGYILIDKTYINAKTKMHYICPFGHKNSITWGNWVTGYRCPDCAHNAPVAFKEVKKSFEQAGYQLLTKTYINAKQKLLFICNNGHTYSMTWDRWKQGHRCRICGGTWKEGIGKIRLPLYSTYMKRLAPFHEIKEVTHEAGFILLGVHCEYCNKVTVPNIDEINHRLGCLEGTRLGDQRFYCSEQCKNACSIYKQHTYPKGFKPATSREVQPALRKLVLERDNWTCQKCGKTEVELHCHHIDPVINNPIESADVANCITFCKDCHKKAHKLPGCNYSELKC